MYHFHRDDEIISWKVLGVAARNCLAMGLHQPATYNHHFTDEEERTSALRTFWVVYVLDRRWSFGSGLPFALTDPIDETNMPKPVCLYRSFS